MQPSFEQAPLLDLFKASMIIETDNSQPDRILSEKGIRSSIMSLTALLPIDDVMTSILQATEKFWPLWRPFPEQVFRPSMHDQSSPVTLAKKFILESFKSGAPSP
jgi:hypothetical protein